jgi:hypothetical protein
MANPAFGERGYYVRPVRFGTVRVLKRRADRALIECNKAGHRTWVDVATLRPGTRAKTCPKCLYAVYLFVKRQKAARKRWGRFCIAPIF